MSDYKTQLFRTSRMFNIMRDAYPNMRIEQMLALLFIVDRDLVTFREVQDQLELSQSTVSTMLAPMKVVSEPTVKGLGLIDGGPDPMNQRRTILWPTKKGIELARRMMEAVGGYKDTYFSDEAHDTLTRGQGARFRRVTEASYNP